jgi:glycosyltransferase involved in cell wall biosynthesis
MTDASLSASAAMTVAVFSCDRAAHLSNCVASVERHMPGVRVTVWDDGSTDVPTLAALERIAARHRVRRLRAGDTGHLGGLRAAMRAAIDDAQGTAEWLLMLQDDQQIVRPLDAIEILAMARIFDGDASVTQIVPQFLRGYTPRATLRARYPADRRLDAYESAGTGFADTGVLHLHRFGSLGTGVGESEGAATLAAHAAGARLMVARDPWMMFCPWPNTVRKRGGRLEKAMRRVNDWTLGAGVHPFADMDGAAVARLRARPIETHPVADDWLVSTPKLRRPWWYTDAFDPSKMIPRTRLLDPRWPFQGPREYEVLRAAVRAERT